MPEPQKRSPLLGVGPTILLTFSLNISMRADCVPLGARQLNRQSARVLEGTVLQQQDVSSNLGAVTVEVHRVWKGAVTPTAVFYYETAIDASPVLKTGDRRVFFGYRQSADDRRKLYGVKDDSPFFTLGCDAAMPPTPEVIKGLGRARTPRN